MLRRPVRAPHGHHREERGEARRARNDGGGDIADHEPRPGVGIRERAPHLLAHRPQHRLLLFLRRIRRQALQQRRVGAQGRRHRLHQQDLRVRARDMHHGVPDARARAHRRPGGVGRVTASLHRFELLAEDDGQGLVPFQLCGRVRAKAGSGR